MKPLLVAVVTSIVATVGCLAQPQPSPTPAPSATSVRSSIAISPTPSEESLDHYLADGIGFDYPSDWQVRRQDVHMRFQTVLAFVGTAPSEASCSLLSPGGCGTNWNLKPGTVSVEIVANGGPQPPPLFEMSPPPGYTAVTVGGLPAFFGPAPLDVAADLALSWTLSSPLSPRGRYHIVAAARAPGIEARRAEIEALISSVQYEPPVLPLPTGEVRDRAVADALDTLSVQDSSFDCFPRRVGGSAEAVIRDIPHYAPMRKDLPVTCSTDVEETPIGLWRMMLTIAWDSARDRQAGSITTVVWVDGDGGLHGSESGPHDEPPYWP